MKCLMVTLSRMRGAVTPYVGVWIEIHPFIRSLEAGLIQRFTNILSLFESHFSLEYAIIYRKMED